MRKYGVRFAVLLAPVLMVALPNAPDAQEVEAQEESPFLLQDHGGVRVIRGLEPGKNFEAATLPQEVDVAPAAAPEPRAEPQRQIPRTAPRISTRQQALRRVRERGIPVIPVGATRVPRPAVDSARTRAIDRVRQRAAPTNRPG